MNLRFCAFYFAACLSHASAQQSIDSFTLINADTDLPIAGFDPIAEGVAMNLATLPTRNLNIRINGSPVGDFGSVRFVLTGPTPNGSKTENVPPWAVWGDTNGNFKSQSFAVGGHILTATPYPGNKASGVAGASRTLAFSVVDPEVTDPTDPTDPTGSVRVLSFTLINADTDLPVPGFDPIPEGAEMNLGALPSANLNIRVNTSVSGDFGNVKFQLNGPTKLSPNPRTEGTPPWAVWGDSNGNYGGQTFQPGAHLLTSTADDGNGNPGALSLNFTVIGNGPVTPPPPVPGNPIVSIQSPSSGTTLPAPADFLIEVSAEDPGGAIVQVEFFLDEASLGVDLEAPYKASVNALPPGIYAIKAAALDNEGNTTVTPLLSVQVALPTDGGLLLGELRQWHKLTILFDGPETSETALPNPFLDYRLDVTFTGPSGQEFVVPGYYAADGNAANSGATSGNKWAVHWTPDAVGPWTYLASFKAGETIAVNESVAGIPVNFHGASGSFRVDGTNKTGRDFRGKGRLDYVGGHYLRFAGSGEYFLKQGADSPENLLAYADFDGSFKSDGINDKLIKTWTPHVADWQPGDPVWGDGKGKGLIGAVNYLASEGMNAMSFLTMNVDGDDDNVFPYLNYAEFDEAARERLDVSRLAQWEIFFEHATRKGIFLHFKTQETENELLLDGGNLGPQRKLYYRELIARFGHHLALNWNLGEEINDATTAQKQAWAQFFRDNDPYDHHMVIHNGAKHFDLLGDASELTGLSLQSNNSDFTDVHDAVKRYLSRSKLAGKPWAVACDEPGDPGAAIRPDTDAGASHDDGRRNALYGTLLAGGWGNEWYFGYKYPNSDLSLQDFRSRDQWWDFCRHALEFFRTAGVPFWTMENDNEKSSALQDYCFFLENEAYVVYLKQGGATALDLSNATGSFTVRWYNPRQGGAFQAGAVTSVSAGGPVSLGVPPGDAGLDWLILVTRETPLNPNIATANFSEPIGGRDPVNAENPGLGNPEDSDGDGSPDSTDLLPNEASSSGTGSYTILIPVPDTASNGGEGSGTLVLAPDLHGQLTLTMGDGSVLTQSVSVVDGVMTIAATGGNGDSLVGEVRWSPIAQTSDFHGSELQWIIEGSEPIPVTLMGAYYRPATMESLVGSEVTISLAGDLTEVTKEGQVLGNQVKCGLSLDSGAFDPSTGVLDGNVLVDGRSITLRLVYFPPQELFGGHFHDSEAEVGLARVQPSVVPLAGP